MLKDIKEFKEFNGFIKDNNNHIIFSDGSNFNNGIATCNDKVLFAKGYYIYYRNLIKYLDENGSLKNIENVIEELDNKALKRVK